MAVGRSGRTGPEATGRPKRRDPLWAKLTLTLGALLMLASGGTIVGARVLINQATSNIQQQTLIPSGAAAAPKSNGHTLKGPLTFLLAGIDSRVNGKLGARADSIVIVYVPESHDQAYLISVPRDWRVEMPDEASLNSHGGFAKINAAFQQGYSGGGDEKTKRARGMAVLSLALHKATGITFNGAAIIDFHGFEGVIKELGGVRMCIDHRVESIHLAYDKNGKIVLTKFDEEKIKVSGIPPGGHRVVYEVGCRTLDPVLALDYSRQRFGLPNTDYDRQRHQQQLLKAMAKKATSAGVLSNPLKVDRIIKAAGKAFVLDTQGVPIDDFIFTLKGVAANDVVALKTNNGTYNNLNLGGVSFQKMSPESMEMLRSVADNTLPDFVLNHPTVIQRSKDAG